MELNVDNYYYRDPPKLTKKPQNRIRFRLTVLPLRLHIDQDSMIFLMDYLVMAFPQIHPYIPIIFRSNQDKEFSINDYVRKPSELLYIESAIIDRIKITFDYKPKNIVQSMRRFIQIPSEFINFTSVNNVTISLHKLRIVDVFGWDVLLQRACSEWYPQFIRTLPVHYITGISLMKPIVSVGSGILDLVKVPCEVYKADGISKGLGLGALSFATKLFKGAADGAAIITVGATNILELIDESLGRGKTETSKYANQPANIIEGFQEAYTSISQQLKETSDNFLVIPREQYELYGTSGYVSAMARAIPLAIVKPIMGTTEGMSKVILAAKNQINQEDKKIADSKYRQKRNSPY